MELSERTDGNSGHFLPLYLLLLEEGNQYQVYLDDIRSIPLHKLVICCLSVDAVNFCQNNSLEYIVPDDCYTSSEGELSWEMSQSKVADLVTRLNEYYHGIFPSVNGFRFDMGNYHLFMLYHFFGALHFRSFFLSKMIEKHGPDKVLVFKSDAVDNSERPFPVSVYPNCYFELLLNSIYKEKIIPIIIGSIGIGKKIPYKMRVRNLAGRMLRKNSIIKKYLDHARVNLRLNLLELFFKQKKKDILLIGTAGPWKYVFSDSRLSGRIDAVFELDEIDYSSLDVKNWFYQWFGWEDIFCGFDVMALAHHEMTRVKVLSERIVKLHSQTASYISQFKAAIFSVSPYAFQQYMLSVAKHIEIPRICFQHGEMGLYPDGLWDIGSELMYLSHYFSYGDEVSNFKMRRAVSDDFKKAISIGAPSLDNLNSYHKCITSTSKLG